MLIPQQRKKRLNFLVEAEVKEVITRAAYVTGKSLSEFAISSLTRSAQEVLKKPDDHALQ